MALRALNRKCGLILLCSAVNSALRVISLSCSMRDTSIWVEMSWERPTAISFRGAGDAVGAAIVDLEGAADGAILPQRDDDDRVEIGQMVLTQIVADDDLIQQHRPLGHVADGVVLVQLVVVLAHPT